MADTDRTREGVSEWLDRQLAQALEDNKDCGIDICDKCGYLRDSCRCEESIKD